MRYQSTVDTKTHARIASRGLASWGGVEGGLLLPPSAPPNASSPPFHWAGQTAGVTPGGGARGLWACALEASGLPRPLERMRTHVACVVWKLRTSGLTPFSRACWHPASLSSLAFPEGKRTGKEPKAWRFGHFRRLGAEELPRRTLQVLKMAAGYGGLGVGLY